MSGEAQSRTCKQRVLRPVLVEEHGEALRLALIARGEGLAQIPEGEALIVEEKEPLLPRVGQGRKEGARPLTAKGTQARHGRTGSRSTMMGGRRRRSTARPARSSARARAA